jgi:H+/Cl- antiporter ClcA
MSTAASTAGAPAAASARQVLRLVPAALLIGVGSSLVLLALSIAAAALQKVLWGPLPAAFGVDPHSSLWIFATLTATGVAVGLVIWLVPGHAGPDPACEGLGGPPQPLGILPGLVLATVLGLAGGASLGPENPITMINIALAWLAGRTFGDRDPAHVPLWAGLGLAGTIGAMFGTPVAAALLLSEVRTESKLPLWDRMFAPLVAAGAGSVTTHVLAGNELNLVLQLVPSRDVGLVDLLSGGVIAVLAAGAGLVLVYAFPKIHAAFRRLRHPLLTLTAGGVVLGALGALGGPLTLFKGLDEMKELVAGSASYGVSGLLVIVLVKMAALIVSASSGFRGGRIFPAVFIGVAIGLLVSALVPSVPQSVCVASATLGILLATTRDGWLSLFLAAVLVPGVTSLPFLCIVLLPAWLVLMGRRALLVSEPRTEPSETARGAVPGP